MSNENLHNDGGRPLTVPGFNNVPLHLELHLMDRFSHGANDVYGHFWWTPRINLTARELTMLGFMSMIVEREAWHLVVFDPEAISALRREALLIPLMSASAWEWCLAELQDKATLFVETNRVFVLNTYTGVCISEKVALYELRHMLSDGVNSLQSYRAGQLTTDAMVRDIVDPSLYPLVYGKTCVLTNGEHVDLDRPWEFISQAEVAPTYDDDYMNDRSVRKLEEQLDKASFYEIRSIWSRCFSGKFQRLPCEVEFTRRNSTSVRITSYINNINPLRHRDLYRTIEKLLSLAIQPWNDVLMQSGHGRWPVRVKTYGVSWDPGYLDREYIYGRSWDEGWHHPEPGVSFTYEQWKSGQTSEAIVPDDTFNDGPVSHNDDEFYDKNAEGHEYYSVSLQDTFQKAGLQVVVQIRSIELTPGQPTFPGGDWQIGGTQNDHIVAAALFPFSVTNTTQARISFRQEGGLETHRSAKTPHGEYALGKTFAVEQLETIFSDIWASGFPATQTLGSVASPQDRLLAWSTTLHHREEPFELLDATKPGHRKYIIFWLVDPHYRVCSTRNVPPQQHDWWAEEALPSIGAEGMTLPPEILSMIDEQTDEWPMSADEAALLRSKMVEERNQTETWQGNSACSIYGFYSH